MARHAYLSGQQHILAEYAAAGKSRLRADNVVFSDYAGVSDLHETVDLRKALEERYLSYALSTIMQRALRTETRFVVITHNPITMARMNRLFGVTMAERGVSQLVSVDLQEAARLRAAS